VNGATDIGWWGLAASLVLVAVAVGVSATQGLGLSRTIMWACSRAAVQLLAVGAALGLVLDPSASVVWSWLWVAVMTVFAGATVARRTPEVAGLFVLAWLACVIVALVSLGVIFGLGIFPTEPRAIVPLGGMMVGNAMAATVVAVRRIIGELSEQRPEVEARLALGQPWPAAARPYVRRALRTALTSQIESTKAVGLVFLPGAMVGLVLAGVDARDAVMVQLAVMYLILGSAATAVMVIGRGLTRRLFTSDHRLRPLPRDPG
jgi:putative ABC transport system permease protein